MSRPRLLSGTKNASSWAMRAWLALVEAGVDFDEAVVDIRRPQRFENLAGVGEIAPPASVPVFVTGEGDVLYDSLAIMEYANDASGGRLLPVDLGARGRARSLIGWQHAGLSGICGRISFESAFYPEKRALTAEEQAQTTRLWKALDVELRTSGGPWLFGALSLADLILAPTAVRLSSHAVDLSAWPAVAAWRDALLARPSVEAWMAEARLGDPVWLDDYRIPDAPSSIGATRSDR